VAQELHGEDPGFEGAILSTHDHAAFSGYGKGLNRLDGTGDYGFEIGEREGGDRGEGLSVKECGDGERCNEEREEKEKTRVAHISHRRTV
jgi:hypothetical protein